MADETTATSAPDTASGAGTEQAAPPAGGQATTQPAAGAGAGAAPTAGAAAGAKPWFEHGGRSFKDSAELSAHLDSEVETGRRERLNQQHYTAEIAKLREQQRQHEAAVAKHNEEAARFNSVRPQYEQLDAIVRQRPEIGRQIAQLIGQAPSAADISEREDAQRQALREEIMGEFKPMLDEYNERRKQEEEDRMIQEVIGDKRVFPYGVDESKVNETLAAMKKQPDFAREIVTVVAKLHAHPSEVAGQNGAAASAQGAGTGRTLLPASGSGGAAVPPEGAFKKGATFEEIREQALRNAGIEVG